VRRADCFFIREVGDRAGDFERAVIHPHFEAKPVDGSFEKLLPFPVDLAELFDLLRAHRLASRGVISIREARKMPLIALRNIGQKLTL
jgi:hypothetical protein